jgi:hypothetical protein
LSAAPRLPLEVDMLRGDKLTFAVSTVDLTDKTAKKVASVNNV